MTENAHTDPHSLNWKRATALIWEADDAELTLIIETVMEHERLYGAVITAVQLRSVLQFKHRKQ